MSFPSRLVGSASLLRASAESVLGAAALLAGLVSAADPGSGSLVRQALELVILPAAAAWLALRLRRRLTSVPVQVLEDVLIAALVGAACGLVWFQVMAWLSARGWEDPGRIQVMSGNLIGRTIVHGGGAVFLAVRLGIRAWRRWTRLRVLRLTWELTHRFMLAACAAGLTVVVLLALVQAWSLNVMVPTGGWLSAVLSRLVFGFVPTFLVSLILGVMLLALLLPLVGLASYWTSRNTTTRLENLVAAVEEFSSGDFATRMPVQGEDEVGRLQLSFNAMADNLQRTVTALETEKSRSEGLLQSRRQLFSNVSHDLMTPVSVIRSWTETGRRLAGGDDPEIARCLSTVEREAVHLQGLIEDLFTLARSDEGRLTIGRVPVDVSKVMRSRFASLSDWAWKSRRVRLVAVPSDGVPQAVGDEQAIGRILTNLIHNAVRETPAGGIVSVEASWEEEVAPSGVRGGEGAVVLSVSDTGPGIPESELPRIWERFQSGGLKERTGASSEIDGASEKSATREAQAPQERSTSSGTGLGLAVVRELAEAMSARLEAHNIAPAGMCFRLILPSSKYEV